MLKSIKKLFVNILTGASLITSLMLIGVGYSDRINPADHPLLACLGLAFPIFIFFNVAMLLVMLIFKWQRAWIALLGFVFAYVPIRTYFPFNTQSEIPSNAIKVLSYNVCGYGGNYKYEKAVDTVANYLKRVDADIVCLQEDMKSKSGAEPFGRLKELYPYNDTVHVNHPTALYVNAVGIHTRYPIIRKEHIEYGSPTNGTVAFFLQIGEDTVIVINNHLESTHLSTNDRARYKQIIKGDMERQEAREEAKFLVEKLGESMAMRAPQAEAVHQFIADHSSYPIIVCGDFNDTPISYARHVISQSLTDCFVETGRGLGITFNQKGFNFRIDHIMCSQHFEPFNCKVDDSMDASDHNPIMCWLKKKQ